MKEKKTSNPLILQGKIIGLTKVKNTEGMALRVTLTGGIFFELANIKDKVLFEKFSKIIELDNNLKFTIQLVSNNASSS